jgi:hypothetical protein
MPARDILGRVRRVHRQDGEQIFLAAVSDTVAFCDALNST